MSVHVADPPLTHAKNSKGEWKYVRDVPNGIDCGCICPVCNEPLIAKHCLNEGKMPHFAHVSGVECHGAQMSALHQRAQEIILEKKAVMAPEDRAMKATMMFFVDVCKEDSKTWEGIRPDIVGETADGKKWAIEIFYTNEVNDEKRDKILKNGVACFEINIKNQSFEQLEDFLLNSCDDRYWINNPYYDLLIREMPSRSGVPEIVEHSYPINCSSLKDFYNYLDDGRQLYLGAKYYEVYDFELAPDCSALWVVHYNPSRNMPPYKLTKFYIKDNQLWGETITKSLSKIMPIWKEIVEELRNNAVILDDDTVVF